MRRMGGATREEGEGGVGANLFGEVEVAVDQLQRGDDEEDEDSRQGHGRRLVGRRRRRMSLASPVGSGLAAHRIGCGSSSTVRASPASLTSSSAGHFSIGPFELLMAHGPFGLLTFENHQSVASSKLSPNIVNLNI